MIKMKNLISYPLNQREANFIHFCQDLFVIHSSLNLSFLLYPITSSWTTVGNILDPSWLILQYLYIFGQTWFKSVFWLSFYNFSGAGLIVFAFLLLASFNMFLLGSNQHSECWLQGDVLCSSGNSDVLSFLYFWIST